jgi:putative DNA primase/helicase
MADLEGRLWNVQRIASEPRGDSWPKFYLKGARTKGLFWAVGEAVDQLVIGEGVATVAAVRRATGLPVVAAMTAGNLPDVAAAIHARRPGLTLIIAADDDEAGHKAARLAAQRTGAKIALPGAKFHG